MPAGRPRKLESPEQLWDYFLKFVEHERNSPMFKREYVGKDGREVDTALMVPITFEAFELYLLDNDVIYHLGSYERDYPEFLSIITRIKQFCFSQNFKGASVGLFNPNIIAKKLGLIDKQHHTVQQEQPLFPDVSKDNSNK